MDEDRHHEDETFEEALGRVSRFGELLGPRWVEIEPGVFVLREDAGDPSK